jgi:aldehyde dehydrogenase (NAD+)
VPTVSGVIEEMIKDTFDERYIAVVQGNRDVNAILFEQRWDVIFFTGSPALAKTVMAAAAKHLTPLVLELGGKSPCVIDKDADIKLAAKRIAWGKTLNAGQTCIAPDYLLIHRDVKEEFIKAFKRAIVELHGEDIHLSPHYARMVSSRAFERVRGYLKDGVIRYGGDADAMDGYIEPTLLDNVAVDSAVMREEIFGPVLPMIEIDNLDQAIEFVNDREKPLALYVFAAENSAKHIVEHTSSGGACINDVIMHIANEYMPFGGVGNSGIGRYHGRDSLYAFSHRRSVLNTPTWIDLPFRYMPYKLFKIIKHSKVLIIG